jgi:hypothetical protein
MAKCILMFSLVPDLLLITATAYGGWIAGWVAAIDVCVAAVSPLAMNRLRQTA